MIIDRLTQTNDRDPASGFWYGPVAGPTVSGVPVNENIAMTLSACWASTRILAAPGGYLPFNLHRRLPGGGSEIATDHPVHTILHDAPNHEMGAMMWRCMGIAQQVNLGNTFAEIERTVGGDLLALWPIHASRVAPARTEDNEFYYLVHGNSGPPVPVPPEDMFHPPSMMSDDGIWGKGVIRHARETIGHSLATEAYGAAWFKSGGKLSAILKHPKKMDKEARDNFRREWKTLYGGPLGERIGILWEGMEYEGIASDPEDSQFIASRQHNIEDIARWYGVPPHMIQHLLRATFNNIEELGLEFVRYCLLPWLKLWEQEVWRKLLTPAEQKLYFAKHNVDALERGDMTKRTAALAQQFFNGALTLNQWMSLEDRNPIGPNGDVHFVQSAMVPLEFAVEGPQAPPAAPALPEKKEPPADKKSASDESAAVAALREEFDRRATEARDRQRAAAVKNLEAAVARVLAKESNEARRAAKKAETFRPWIGTFYEKLLPTMVEAIEPAVAILNAIDEGRIDAGAVAGQHVSRSSSELLSAIAGQPEDLPARVESVLEQWKLTRTKVEL